VTARSRELYDYDELRARRSLTVFVRPVAHPIVVLGSRQPESILRDGVAWTRRRGGGGAVLLSPGDLWVDVWTPRSDASYQTDATAAAERAGRWWQRVLESVHPGPFAVATESPSPRGDALWACFAGVGRGEVTLTVPHGDPATKVVGVTQWRVREGGFVSCVLPAHSSADLADMLIGAPPTLRASLQHESLSSLGLSHNGEVIAMAGVSAIDAREIVRTPTLS
jgi:lipoate-protein ligase A